MKGFTLKNFLVFAIILGVVIYLGISFYKNFSKSSKTLAKESAEAIYKSANLYYINDMMLIGEDSYFCDFSIDGCKELSLITSNKPLRGKISIVKGDVNAILEYKDKTLYICNNNVTESDYCLVNVTREITLENIKKYYDLNNSSKFEGYYCELSKDCDQSFESFFKQTGKIIIDNKGKITASISVLNYDYYICDSSINFDKKCLIDESIKTILDVLNDYHKTNSKDKKYEGLNCELEKCDLKFNTILIPQGNISIDKKGNISAELKYNDITKYICSGKISEEKCIN